MLFIQTRERRESLRALIIIFPAELMHGTNPFAFVFFWISNQNHSITTTAKLDFSLQRETF